MTAGPFYPIGPFRDWLIYQRDRHERLYAMSQDEFARRLGVPERKLYRWLYENTVVALDSVDAVVCGFGDPALLNELCPVGSETDRPRPARRLCGHGDQDRDAQGRCRACEGSATTTKIERGAGA